MSKRKMPKGQSQIAMVKQKDISTYMSVFPLEQSQMYMGNPINQSSYLQQLQTSKMIKDSEIVEGVKNMMKLEKINNNAINSHLKSITTTPIISKNPTRAFVDEYQLNENQILPVCETKFFVFKNYYNYLLDDEIELAAGKIQQRNQNLQKSINLTRGQILVGNIIVEQPDHSKFTAKGRKQQQDILDPKHLNFEQAGASFYPKQKQRLEMSKARKDDSYFYNNNINSNNNNVWGNNYPNQNQWQYY